MQPCSVSPPTTKAWGCHRELVGGLWFATAALVAAIFGSGDVVTGAGGEVFRFVFPVIAAFVLAIALMFQTCCPKTLIAARRDRNRATAAQQQLANVVGSDDVSFVRVSARRLAGVKFGATSLLSMSFDRIP